MKTKLQELEFPALLRIDDSEEPTLYQIAEMLSVGKEVLQAGVGTEAEENETLKATLVEIICQIWRLKSRLSVLEKHLEPRLVKGMEMVLKSMVKTLDKAHFELKDHTGELVRGQEAWTVVSWEEVAGLELPQVIETIRPTIYYKDELIQPGEIIAGKPLAD